MLTIAVAAINLLLAVPGIAEQVLSLYQQYKNAGVNHVTPEQVDADLARLGTDVADYDNA